MHCEAPGPKASDSIDARTLDSVLMSALDPHHSGAGRGDLRTEIAAAAARRIAEDGADYAAAKRKAVAEVLGAAARARAVLPDNAQIEAELRRYLATFMADRQPAVLGSLRLLSLQLMQRLNAFNPHLVGAVLNGTATEHSDLHLHLFTDDAKQVEMFLLDQGVEFDVAEAGSGVDAPRETLQFVIRPARTRGTPARVGVVLDVYDVDAIRVAPRYRSNHPGLHPVEATGRAGAVQVETLIRERHPDLWE